MKFYQSIGSGKAVRVLVATLATSLLATVAAAHEGDHWPLTGDQLKMRYSADGKSTKFQFKSKRQVNINQVSIAEDPTISRSTLFVRGGGASPGGTGVIELDPSLWKRIGTPESPKGWKYKSDPYYSDGVTKVQIKSSS